jgi:hypothetical protein
MRRGGYAAKPSLVVSKALCQQLACLPASGGSALDQPRCRQSVVEEALVTEPGATLYIALLR